MKNKLSRLILVFFALALVSCANDSQESKGGEIQKAELSCGRPSLLKAREEFSTSWIATGISDGDLGIGEGESLNYLDWGTLSQNGSQFSYTAPDFIPETRQLSFHLDGQDDLVSNCSVYVLTADTFGVKDDGTAVGLVAEVYPVATTQSASVFPALNGNPTAKAVLRNLDMVNVPAFTGITAATSYVAMRITGTIQISVQRNYRFRLTASQLGHLYIDGTKLVTSTGNAAQSASPGVSLAPGKHNMTVEYLLTSGTRTLKLEWQPTEGNTTYAPIPYTMFDRP